VVVSAMVRIGGSVVSVMSVCRAVGSSEGLTGAGWVEDVGDAAT
jgi:hypothetical protein